MANHHVRHPSNHSKRPLPANARPSKPASQSKRTHSHGASRKAVHHKAEEFEDEEVMATSFLQYCTTCEKQIIVPSNSVLYCSESCRNKDTEKQYTTPYDCSPPVTPFSNVSFDEVPFRDIVPPRSPTQLHSKRSSCAFSEMSSDDNTTSSDEKSKRNSEASRYLRQFQNMPYSVETNATVRTRRPPYNRASTSQISYSAAPSLSHTPASSASFSLPYTPLYTPLYTTSARPLPSRANPYSSSYGSRSIDLVTPWTQPQPETITAPSSPRQYSFKGAPSAETSLEPAAGKILYAKSPIPLVSPANGSLSRLLASRS